jgi:hypothetical protein
LKLRLIKRFHFAAIEQHAARDYRVKHVARLRAEDDRGRGFMHGRGVSSRKIDRDQVRLLTRFERACLARKP